MSLIKKDTNVVESILKFCEICGERFTEDFIIEKIEKIKSRFKWVKDINHKGNYRLFTKCPFCKRKVKIAEIIFKNKTAPDLKEEI